MQPNFLFIGPDKTGSSWLYEVLAQHPDCYVPAVKDLYFFDRYYDRGLAWYFRFFEDAPASTLACGELSHDYLLSPVAAERIARDLPGVRLITSLRDPVDRTFSHYLYMVRSGRTRLPFHAAVERFPELIENSLYAKHLAVYLRLFGRDRLKVLLFENLVADPEALARDVFAYLGLRFIPGIDYRQHVLPASRPRSFVLARLAKEGANLARRLGFAALVGRVKQSRAAASLYIPFGRQDRPRPDPQVVAGLRALFAEDLQQLEQILDVNVAHWLPGATQPSI